MKEVWYYKKPKRIVVPDNYDRLLVPVDINPFLEEREGSKEIWIRNYVLFDGNEMLTFNLAFEDNLSITHFNSVVGRIK